MGIEPGSHQRSKNRAFVWKYYTTIGLLHWLMGEPGMKLTIQG